ncbi:MAG TPA: polysaccharide biosynthesis/export family protein [candidate division Zixibacteria bacterium]|nr:polysaccharide biosynthesis/export family protein [candidate division Zixibacteria bacterium]
MSRIVITRIVGALAVAIAVCGWGVDAKAQTGATVYRIGPEDVIEVRFWQDPNLNATVRVRNDGKITLDIIGEIQATGLTEKELQDQIVRLISRINPQVSQATVRVTEYNSQRVFIFGEVKAPGKYTFEHIPDLWTLINEAGGATDIGDLTRVRIIRGGENQGEVEEVDVAGLLAAGKTGDLPKIRTGDTIELLRTFGGVERPRVSQGAGLKSLYYIIGEVNDPGAHPLEPNIDLLDAIALAGGPTSGADLDKVRVLSKDGTYAQVVTVNVTEYSKSGQPARYFIRPEDTIVLPSQSTGFLGLRRIGDIIGLASGLTSIVLLVDRL